MADASLAPDHFYVYVHCRLNTGEPFYIGKGHGARANTHRSRNPHWKNIVAKDGGRDVDIFAKGMDEEFAFLVEMEAIDIYKRRGFPLVNLTDGGDGTSGYCHTGETRAKMRVKVCSDETRSKMRASAKGKTNHLGHIHSAESRAKISTAAKIRMSDPASRAKISDAVKLQMADPVNRAKISAALRGHTPSADTRAKLRATNKGNMAFLGHTHSAEARAKMSVSVKAAWEKRRKAAR